MRTKGSKNSYGLGIEYFWVEYKSKVKDKTFFDIDKALYKKILYEINKEAIRLLIENNLMLALPYGLGNLMILQRKLKLTKKEDLPIDWKTTKELGKVVRLLNQHTDMNTMLFYWDKSTVTIRNRNKYKFSPTRANKRRLALEIKTNKNIKYLTNDI